MDSIQHEAGVSYEMSTLGTPSHVETPTMLTAQSSMAALHAEDPQSGANVQELPPVDRGIRAWTFCFSALVLEMMVWGFGFRSVSI